MSQGLFTAVSGIKACQSKIDVISDNIANMNTVGFKSSQVSFENVFVRTLSSGSAPSSGMGGTNPIQIGLGATIGEISRNFAGGTIQTTGRSTDLNIQGNGFFSLASPEGGIYLSRAGNFTVDADGYLVNSKGLRVLGTASTVSNSGSTTPVRIPQSLRLEKPVATNSDTVAYLTNANGSGITPGVFCLNVTRNIADTDPIEGVGDTGGNKVTAGTINFTADGVNKSVTIEEGESLSTVLNHITTAIGGGATSVVNADGTFTINCNGVSVNFDALPGDTSNFKTLTGLSGTSTTTHVSDTLLGTNAKAVDFLPTDTVATLTSKMQTAIGGGTVTMDPATGRITVTPPAGTTVDYTGNASDTSNFLSVAGFTGTPATSTQFLSNGRIEIGTGDNSSYTYPLASIAIGKDGAIEATYANGDKITVTGDPTRSLMYKTSTGITITGNNITVEGGAISANELQLQLVNVLNPKGLISQGGNMFTAGPNAGAQTFAIGRAGGMGLIDSGGLESSNVDLPSEFAEMIIAQRGIDANSRTFTTQNQIMQTIVNLGRM